MMRELNGLRTDSEMMKSRLADRTAKLEECLHILIHKKLSFARIQFNSKVNRLNLRLLS
jgi:hypothetical protein